MQRKVWNAVVLAVLVVGAPGCRSRITGNEGNLTVASTIDTASKTLVLVEPGDVDGADFYDPMNVPRTLIGATTLYNVVVSVGGQPVCQAFMDNTATSTSPAICEVMKVAAPDSATGPKNEFGWVKVTGKAAGTCNFTVTWAQANGGVGLTVPLSVMIGS